MGPDSKNVKSLPKKKGCFVQSKNTKEFKKLQAERYKENQEIAKRNKRGVVMFSNIPHGFYENEQKKYCSQFGQVTGVCVPRSVYGRSKGYSFVEFRHAEVAEIVAETMNNFLMFKKIMKATVVPPEKQRPFMFHGDSRFNRKTKKMRRLRTLQIQQDDIPDGKVDKFKKKTAKKLRNMRSKLKKMNVDLEFQVA